MREFFLKYGEVKECFIKKDAVTTKSKGFAFVTFAESTSADAVIKEGALELDGKYMEPKKALPHTETKLATLKKTL